ncbi:Serralysin [Prochlorococcus marinus str. MIT 1313]|uniref:cadherin domain-containing protein n=1 Tax=Prochlorococcus TaxID=1218 RepID=UPI0007B3A844|nr:cadherin domain-containing protein [Prochlorococcus marinus]KZR70526.1 Serralysin [Prochlorococcus marinus str. MIT 1313]
MSWQDYPPTTGLNSSNTWSELSGDNLYIAGIMSGGKWGNADPDSDITVDLNYSFDLMKYGLDWHDEEKAVVEIAQKAYQDVGNIRFIESNDFEAVNIDWMLFDRSRFKEQLGVETELDNGTILGMAWGPSENDGHDFDGSVFINPDAYRNSVDGTILPNALSYGSYSALTFTHELGHALGLSHPHDTWGENKAFPGVPEGEQGWNQGGENGLNATPWSVMTYNTIGANDYAPSTHIGNGFITELGAFDIAGIQYLYGPNNSNKTGDDTYSLDLNLNGFQSLWDASGNDTIDASNSTGSVTIDLRNATLENEPGGGGFVSQVDGKFKGYTIAYNSTGNAVIENAKGSVYEDYLRGNSSNNTLDGQAGFDTAAFSGNINEYNLSLNGNTGGFQVADSSSSRDGTDQLFNVELINFNGLTYDFPTDITLSATSFDENLAAGTAIASLSATDPDSGSNHSFLFSLGSENEDNASFSITGNQLSINEVADYETKDAYSIRLKAIDGDGLAIAKSFRLDVNNLVETPTYVLNTSSNFLNEGESLTTNISTTNVDLGTELFWSLSGDNITAKDLEDGQLSGSNQVNGQGEFTISNTFAEDWRREGTENVLIKLFSDSARLSKVAETGSIEITDTSVSISETWPAKVGVTEATDLKLAYKLNSNVKENLSQLAVLGDNVDFSKRYTLEISGEVTGETKDNNYNLESAEIIVKLDPFLFNTVKASDIRISNDLPIANAVHIDEDTGNIRIAAAGLSDLSAGNAISSETVLASIDLDINESYLQLTDQAAGDLNRKFSDPLLFSLAANQDHTIFSRDFNDGTTHSNREIKSLRELGGNLAVEGTDITLYSGNLNLEEQGDGLVLGTERVIGVNTAEFTNLVRSGDTIQASSLWTNTGNINAEDIQVTGVSNSNAELMSYGFDTGANSVDLNSGRFDNGVFDTAERQSTQLNAEIKITGSAGDLVDLSSGIVNLKAAGVDKTFENTKGSKNLITFQGDLNYDGSVTMKDLAYLNAGAARQQLEDRTGDVDGMMKDNAGNALGEGETKSQASKDTYAADVDADFNGKIDIADLAVLDQDWGKTLHTGDQDFQGNDSNFTWAELNRQSGISKQWDSTSFEDQNALEAKASIGGYDAPLEQILSANTADSNKDADAVTQSEILTGSGGPPTTSDIIHAHNGITELQDNVADKLQDDMIGGAST